MKLSVELPDRLVSQARELAEREHTSVDLLIATSLTTQIDHAGRRPSIAERAARVNWSKVDEILARVPAAPPMAGDEG